MGFIALALLPNDIHCILDLSKLKEFADDNFKLNENGRKLSIRVENIVGKRRHCSEQAISPFPTAFSIQLQRRHVKTRACLGKGYIIPAFLNQNGFTFKCIKR